MSYLDRIDYCNRIDIAHFKRFFVDGYHVGWVKKKNAHLIKGWCTNAVETEEDIAINSDRGDIASRNELFAFLVGQFSNLGLIYPPMNELYPVSLHQRENIVAVVDRVAAAIFGIRCYGQHLNGYVKDGSAIKMWISRRAKDRGVEPGKLDQLVAGGLPFAVSPSQNLIKECWEEAGIPQELAQQAISVGTVSYCAESERGLKPDTLLIYDLELPHTFEPRCTDGEVEAFYLMPIEEVATLVRETTEFKHNCNLVVIDFLVRHGLLPDDDPDYTAIVAGLHPTLPQLSAQ